LTSTSAICSGTGSITINTATSAAPYNLVNADLSSLPVGATVGGFNHTPTFTSGNPHYVLLTPANNDKKGFITFAETTLKPVNFIATFGLYVGNGNGADGTSFNYGKVNTSTGNYGEAGMIDSGLAVGFNDFSNKIFIYYNNVQLTSFNVNGTLNNSHWKSVSIEVTGSGQLTLSHGGHVYCTNYQLPAAYVTDNKTNWKYGFAARTGGLNNLHAVNDVVIKDRTPWEYSLDGTNFTTNNNFTNLNPGTYNAYARIGNAAYNANGYNSTASIGTQTITALSFAATLTPTNPTTCTATGTIAISNVTHNMASYDLVNLSLTNGQLGGAYTGGLGSSFTPYFGAGDLVLTQNQNNQAGFIAFGTNEAQPNAFSANYDVFVGAGNGGDGLSFNYGVLNTVGTAGVAETGMVNSGLAVGFSDYSNTIKIYYNKTVLQSYNATVNAGGYKSVAITVTQDGKITIVHGGITICSNYQLPAAYATDNKSGWQYAFAARTGGSTNYHSVKNVVIKDNDIQYFLGNGNFTSASTLTEVAPGQYTVFARKSNGVHCSNTFQIGTATITYTPDITATVASTSPTTCTSTGGTVTISNVSHGISSPYNLVNISLTNQQLGASTIGNLGTCCNPIWGGFGDLVLTPNTSNRAGYIAFNSTVAQPNAFSANYDVFVGGGNGGDGLSFNYGNLNTSGSLGGAESGMVNSGLAIGFNEYHNTIKIYYNKIELQSYSATLNTNSYKSVAITVTQDGKITIVHGGTTICSNYQLPAAYATDNKSSWQYALAARCGASNNYHSVKNVVIKDNSIQYTINGQYYTEDPHFTNVYPATYNVRARISNGTYCSILSSLGSVTIAPPPGMVAITGQPDTTTRSLRLNATATTLSVTATGADTLRYQWYSNNTASISGSPILGATSASYTPATTEGGTFYYYCIVSNACSNATSALSGGITIKTTFSESCIQAVSAGLYSSIVMKTDGSLWAWGDNNWGQLGDGTQSNFRNSPVKIGTATNWKTVLIGAEHTIAIKTDGTLWAWGKNYQGLLGDGTTTNRNSPVQIGTATNWETVFLGNTSLHTMALKTDGTLWAWGVNSDGQLGDGTTTNRLSPVQIGNATNWKSISLGYSYTVATKTDGTLWTWGNNSFGQLGDGTTTNRSSPVQIGNATNWKSVSAGGLHNFAVKNDGSLWAWGYNNSGQLGDGTTTQRNSPVQIGTANNWASISPGAYYTVAKKTDGSLWAWGENSTGQLGDGTRINKYSPVQTGTDTNWASISAGYDHNLALKTDGSLWVWGANFKGYLGDGTTTRKISPMKLSSCVVCTSTVSTFTVTACGSYTWAAKGNKVYTASNNTDTILLMNEAGCDSVVTLNLTLKAVTSSSNSIAICSSALPYSWNGLTFNAAGTQTKTGFTNAAGCDSSATLTLTVNTATHNVSTQTITNSYIWNGTTYTASGTYTYSYNNANGCASVDTLKLTIVTVSCLNTISAGNDYTIAIKTDGTLWAWGSNLYGKLGDGTASEFDYLWNTFIADNDKKTPVQIGTATNWASISASYYHTIAIKTDGTLWAWGYNGNGQLGDGTTTQRNSPVQIGTANNWKSISASGGHTLAIKTDGTLWAWGENYVGQLGDGTTTQRNSPVQIGTSTNWKEIRSLNSHNIAIKTDGTLWAWGHNLFGQLGDGTTTQRNSPVQIGTATNWASIGVGDVHTMAIKTDGTLWAWGANFNGQLGDGTTTNRNSPVQIGTATNWASISSSEYHNIAVKTDSSLWAWGVNNNGQLGDGTNTNRFSPVQIGTENNWTSISAGHKHTTASKTDGSLWVWGSNQFGALGDGTTTTAKNSPMKLSSCGSSATLNVTAFLQGLYLGGGIMTAAPFNVDGVSSPTVADTITIELHDTTSSHNLIATSKSTVSTTGNVSCNFSGTLMGNAYYVVIKHRNSIATWSTNPVVLTQSNNYDFSNAANKAYGSNMANDGNGVFLIFTGDINQDGSVDFSDYPDLDISSNNGDLGYYATDLNGDASVDFSDYPLLDINSNLGTLSITP
jgi:alpha-tubulin suppressor-like RCC1 family protein